MGGNLKKRKVQGILSRKTKNPIAGISRKRLSHELHLQRACLMNKTCQGCTACRGSPRCPFQAWQRINRLLAPAICLRRGWSVSLPAAGMVSCCFAAMGKIAQRRSCSCRKSDRGSPMGFEQNDPRRSSLRGSHFVCTVQLFQAQQQAKLRDSPGDLLRTLGQ